MWDWQDGLEVRRRGSPCATAKSMLGTGLVVRLHKGNVILNEVLSLPGVSLSNPSKDVVNLPAVTALLGQAGDLLVTIRSFLPALKIQ